MDTRKVPDINPSNILYADWLFWPLFRIFMITSKKGASTGLHLALSEDAASSTGEYWVRSKRNRGNRHARNDSNAKRLWDVSEEMLDE